MESEMHCKKQDGISTSTSVKCSDGNKDDEDSAQQSCDANKTTEVHSSGAEVAEVYIEVVNCTSGLKFKTALNLKDGCLRSKEVISESVSIENHFEPTSGNKSQDSPNIPAQVQEVHSTSGVIETTENCCINQVEQPETVREVRIDEQSDASVSPLGFKDIDVDSIDDETRDAMINEEDCFLPQLPSKAGDCLEVSVANKNHEGHTFSSQGELDDESRSPIRCELDFKGDISNDMIHDTILGTSNPVSDKHGGALTDGRNFLYFQENDGVVSPELFHLANLSPMEVYGKESIGEFSSQENVLQFSRTRSCSSSTLNTPDPLCFEDTDLAGLNLSNGYPQFSPLSLDSRIESIDVNMLEGENGVDSVVKQKVVDCSSGIQFSNVSKQNDAHLQHSNLQYACPWTEMKHQQPCQDSPDLFESSSKKWSSCNIQSSVLCRKGIQYGSVSQENESDAKAVSNKNDVSHGIRPVCTVQPYDQCVQPSLKTNVGRSSCRFNQNFGSRVQTVDADNGFGQKVVGSSAAYRLDFSSPVPFAESIPLIVAQPPCLPSGVSRPVAVPASGWMKEYGGSDQCQYWNQNSECSKLTLQRPSFDDTQGLQGHGESWKAGNRYLVENPLHGFIAHNFPVSSTVSELSLSIPMELGNSGSAWTNMRSNSQCQYVRRDSDRNQMDKSMVTHGYESVGNKYTNYKSHGLQYPFDEVSEEYMANMGRDIEGSVMADLFCWESDNGEDTEIDIEPSSSVGSRNGNGQAMTIQGDGNTLQKDLLPISLDGMQTNASLNWSSQSFCSSNPVAQPYRECNVNARNRKVCDSPDLILSVDTRQSDVLKCGSDSREAVMPASHLVDHVDSDSVRKDCDVQSSRISPDFSTSTDASFDGKKRLFQVNRKDTGSGIELTNNAYSSSSKNDAETVDETRVVGESPVASKVGMTSQSQGSNEASDSDKDCPQVKMDKFHEKFKRRRRKMSPVSAFCAVLDLSRKNPRKKDTMTGKRSVPNILPRIGTPCIPVQSFLNQGGPTLAYANDHAFIPYMNSIGAMVKNTPRNRATASGQSPSTVPDPWPVSVPSRAVSSAVSTNVFSQCGNVSKQNMSVHNTILMPSPFMAPIGMLTATPLYAVPAETLLEPQLPCPLLPVTTLANGQYMSHCTGAMLQVPRANRPSTPQCTGAELPVRTQPSGLHIPQSTCAVLPIMTRPSGPYMPQSTGSLPPVTTGARVPYIPQSTGSVPPVTTGPRVPYIPRSTGSVPEVTTRARVPYIPQSTGAVPLVTTGARVPYIPQSTGAALPVTTLASRPNIPQPTGTVLPFTTQGGGQFLGRVGIPERKPVTPTCTTENLSGASVHETKPAGQDVPKTRDHYSSPHTGVKRKRKLEAPQTLEQDGSPTPPVQRKALISAEPKRKKALGPKDSLVTFYPPPEALNRTAETKVKGRGKGLKARHFGFSSLEIGKFRYKSVRSQTEDIARVKFYFHRKMMIYEFQLANTEKQRSSGRRMVKIEVPFSTIVGLWIFRQEMRVEVEELPEIYMGVWNEKTTRPGNPTTPKYDNKQSLDITNGALATCPYHHIKFRSLIDWKIRADLTQFDQKFSELLSRPFVIDLKKVLMKPGTDQPIKGRIEHYLLDPSIELPPETEEDNGNDEESIVLSSHSAGPQVSCDCHSECETMECPCCQHNVTCMEGSCTCVSCRNPLNILHLMGLPQPVVRTDQCLMDNVYKVKYLDCYVKTQLMLECCSVPMLLLQCIPGQIACPKCDTRYRFSWCLARLCSEKVMPRNHCPKCAQCTDYRNQHCENCHVCYFAGENNEFQCPICRNKKVVTDEENQSNELHVGIGDVPDIQMGSLSDVLVGALPDG